MHGHTYIKERCLNSILTKAGFMLHHFMSPDTNHSFLLFSMQWIPPEMDTFKKKTDSISIIVTLWRVRITIIAAEN